MNHEILKNMLIKHEGLRLMPYHDSVGKLTIGVGRNIDDIGISNNEAMVLLKNDIQRVEDDLDTHLPWWRNMDETRQLVIADMCFNLGIGSLLGFKNTLSAMKEGRYRDAADGMGQSKWASQVGSRATHLIGMMREGTAT
jgi:lysozyme